MRGLMIDAYSRRRRLLELLAATTTDTTSFARGFGEPCSDLRRRIARRQIWPRESYWVRLDCDARDSVGRLFDLDRLEPL